MEVQVRVAVPIIRRKSKRAETLKLRLDLAPQRLRERGRKGVAQPGARGRRGEVSAFVRERGNLRRAARTEREMQADAQIRIPSRDFHGFPETRFVDHQPRVRERARAVPLLDGHVDRRAPAKVIARQQQAARVVFHARFTA